MMDSDADSRNMALTALHWFQVYLRSPGVPQGFILGPLMSFFNMLPLGNQYFFPFLCCDDTVLSINPSVTSLTVDASHSHHISVLFTTKQVLGVLQPLHLAHYMANQ